jgi:hypothetical protein
VFSNVPDLPHSRPGKYLRFQTAQSQAPRNPGFHGDAMTFRASTCPPCWKLRTFENLSLTEYSVGVMTSPHPALHTPATLCLSGCAALSPPLLLPPWLCYALIVLLVFFCRTATGPFGQLMAGRPGVHGMFSFPLMKKAHRHIPYRASSPNPLVCSLRPSLGYIAPSFFNCAACPSSRHIALSPFGYTHPLPDCYRWPTSPVHGLEARGMFFSNVFLSLLMKLYLPAQLLPPPPTRPARSFPPPFAWLPCPLFL